MIQPSAPRRVPQSAAIRRSRKNPWGDSARSRRPSHALPWPSTCGAEIDGTRMSDEDIKAFCSLLLAAGGETTDKAIAGVRELHFSARTSGPSPALPLVTRIQRIMHAAQAVSQTPGLSGVLRIVIH